MKSILKYGLIGGVLLLVSANLPLIPYLNIYFDSSISGAMRFIILGGIMLFGINDFLKHDERKGQYNYGFGFLIGLGTGILSTLICSTLIFMIRYLGANDGIALTALWSLVLYQLPLVFFLSLISPMSFRGKKSEEPRPERTDILDADL